MTGGPPVSNLVTTAAVAASIDRDTSGQLRAFVAACALRYEAADFGVADEFPEWSWGLVGVGAYHVPIELQSQLETHHLVLRVSASDPDGVEVWPVEDLAAHLDSMA